jgi:hypothetical protein
LKREINNSIKKIIGMSIDERSVQRGEKKQNAYRTTQWVDNVQQSQD